MKFKKSIYFILITVFISIFVYADEQILFDSESFQHESNIPAKYAKRGVDGGKNISPELGWEPNDLPKGTQSVAIFVWDSHPVANNWVHWCIINIPTDIDGFDEGVSGKITDGVELVNSFGEKGYGGPQPPPGSGKHTYNFGLYALNTKSLNLSGEVTKDKFFTAIKGKVLDSSVFVGYFEQK